MHDNFNTVRSRIVHFGNFDLALVVGGEHRIDQFCGRHAEWQFSNDDHRVLLRREFHPGANPHRSATQTIIVVLRIHDPASEEVREQRKRLLAQVGDAGIDQLDEIVRQNLAGQPHGDTFRALRKQ